MLCVLCVCVCLCACVDVRAFCTDGAGPGQRGHNYRAVYIILQICVSIYNYRSLCIILLMILTFISGSSPCYAGVCVFVCVRVY